MEFLPWKEGEQILFKEETETKICDQRVEWVSRVKNMILANYLLPLYVQDNFSSSLPIKPGHVTSYGQ